MIFADSFGQTSELVSLRRMTILGLLTLFISMMFVESAVAEQPKSLAGIDSEAALARLSDAQIRALLADRLSQANATSGKSSSFDAAGRAREIYQMSLRAESRLREILTVRDRIGGEFSAAWAKISTTEKGSGLLRFIAATLAAFGLAWLLERVVDIKLRALRAMLRRDKGASESRVKLSRRLSSLGTVLMIDVAVLVLFSVVATVIYLLIQGGDSAQRSAFFYYLLALLVVRFAAIFLRSFYSHLYPHLRLASFSNQAARRMHFGLVITVALTAVTYFTCALLQTLEVNSDAHPLLLILVGNMYVVAFSVTVFLNRAAISQDLMLGAGISSPRYYLANAWPYLIIAITVLLWMVVLLIALSEGQPLYGAILATSWVILFYPAIDAAFEREAVVAQIDKDDVLTASMRVIRLLAGLAVVIVMALAWQVKLLSLSDGGLAAALTSILLQVSLTLLVAYAVWQSVRIWIDRKIAEEDAELVAQGIDLSEVVGGTGLSRTRTLLPLLRMTLRVSLATIVIMLVLSSLGVNIAPVLAGAGVIGLAIGFGSQTLVRDVVSGAFFLVDDAFRIGEYVDVGKVKGTVEKIQLRSLRLRHHRGAVHTVPFGEIATLTNFSRDWAIMKLKFRVPFDTDIEKLRKLFKKVGKKLEENPDIKDDFLQPFKSQGVLEVDDHGLIIRAKFMCKPGSQYLIRRHAFVAIQQAFSENGIEFARPEIRVVSADDDDDDDEDLVKAGAAAKMIEPKPA